MVQELAQRSASGHDNRREPTSGPSWLFLLQDGAAGLRSVVGDALQETSFLPGRGEGVIGGGAEDQPDKGLL